MFMTNGLKVLKSLTRTTQAKTFMQIFHTTWNGESPSFLNEMYNIFYQWCQGNRLFLNLVPWVMFRPSTKLALWGPIKKGLLSTYFLWNLWNETSEACKNSSRGLSFCTLDLRGVFMNIRIQVFLGDWRFMAVRSTMQQNQEPLVRYMIIDDCGPRVSSDGHNSTLRIPLESYSC